MLHLCYNSGANKLCQISMLYMINNTFVHWKKMALFFNNLNLKKNRIKEIESVGKIMYWSEINLG